MPGEFKGIRILNKLNEDYMLARDEHNTIFTIFWNVLKKEMRLDIISQCSLRIWKIGDTLNCGNSIKSEHILKNIGKIIFLNSYYFLYLYRIE